MGVYSSFLYILGGFHLGSTITFACIFGIWARKKHNLLLHSKFSLLSTQRNCVENNRNKTSRVSAFFCTKNHRNPFTSLRERVEWRCHASSKKVQKPKTRVLVMYGCMTLVPVPGLGLGCVDIWRICDFGFWSYKMEGNTTVSWKRSSTGGEAGQPNRANSQSPNSWPVPSLTFLTRTDLVEVAFVENWRLRNIKLISAVPNR